MIVIKNVYGGSQVYIKSVFANAENIVVVYNGGEPITVTGSGGSLDTPSYDFTADGTILVSAGDIVIGALVLANSEQAAFKIGLSAGTDEIVSTQLLSDDGEWKSFSIFYKAAANKTLYVVGITGDGVTIQLVKL